MICSLESRLVLQAAFLRVYFSPPHFQCGWLVHPLSHSLLPTGALLSSLRVFIVYGRLLSKNDEHLIRSLEHVGESRSQETSPGV